MLTGTRLFLFAHIHRLTFVFHIESIRPVIITKSALRPLIRLMALYLSKPMPLDNKEADKIMSAIIREDVRLEVLLNCSHVIFQLGRAGKFYDMRSPLQEVGVNATPQLLLYSQPC